MADRVEANSPQETTHIAQAASVFISYASQDKAVADAVCHALENAGIACWIAPRNVVPGESYAGAIVHAIDDTKLIVLILSEHGASSKHVLREVERASSKGHPVLAFRIDAAPMPADLEYFLNTSQWLDASTVGFEEALPRLAEAVRRNLAPAPRTSPGGKDEPAAPAARLAPGPHSYRSAIALGGVIAACLAFVAVDRLVLEKHPAVAQAPAAAVTAESTLADATIPHESVAVLPFSDMSEKKDQEYFSDGMTEEIINVLAKIPDLRVPARTSSFYFKGKSEDISTIARRLKVAHILEGSVRTAGKAVRISVQLVRADNGYHLWSETYDRKLDDVFKVQDEIAAAVVKALKISLLAGSLPHMQQAERPRNPEAHAQFLQGKYYEVRDTLEDNRKAIASFEAAIHLDPTQAVYWAQLSRTLSGLLAKSPAERESRHDRALRAAEQALALDPQLPQSHIARAKVAFFLDLDFATGASEIAKARALDPADGDVLEWGGAIATASGHLDEALQISLHRQQLDPLSTNAHNIVSAVYFDMGRYADAENSSRRALELSPGTEGAHVQIGLSMLLRGADASAALAEIAQEPDTELRSWGLAMAGQLTGHRDEGDKWLAANESSGTNSDFYSAAQLHAMRGEADQAFAALDRAYNMRGSGLVDTKNDPFLKSLRKDSRFGAFLRKLKLPE